LPFIVDSSTTYFYANGENMKRFLAIYLAAESSPSIKKWEKLDEKTMEQKEAEGIQAWKKWAQSHSKAIIEGGSPLGPTLKVDRNGISKTRNDLTAYTIIEAESHESAAKIFLNHPHFMIFPGDSVEIIECLPLPEM
jgi:hypothetical protein